MILARKNGEKSDGHLILTMNSQPPKPTPASPSLTALCLVIAAFFWIVFIASIPAGYVYRLREGETFFIAELAQLNLTPNFYALYISLKAILVAPMFWITAALILRFRSRDRMALLMVLLLSGYGAISSHTEVGILPLEFPSWRLPSAIAAHLTSLIVMWTLCVFPDGNFNPSWTRWLLLPFMAWDIPRVFFNFLNPEIIQDKSHLLILVTLAWCCGGLVIQVHRYRSFYDTTQRQQTKWVVFGAVVIILGMTAHGLLLGLVLPNFSRLTQLLYNLIANPILLTIPAIILQVSLAVSILRYRLWDIDFVINRSLVYGALTILLTTIFGVTLWLVSAVTQQSVVAFSIGAIAVGAAFQPTRRRLQVFVDQHFYNIYVDYQKTRARRADEMIRPRHTSLGEYKGLEWIGHGGMAEVYKASHPTLNQTVAIKILSQTLAADPDFRHRFQREAKTVSQLQHPNIVRILDFGEENDTHYMVMEYLNGKDLSHYIQERGRLTLDQALPIIHDIANALDYAHAHGLVHRDIKPSNIMLDAVVSRRGGVSEKFRAVLMDFGIAKIMSSNTLVTQAGGVLGTFDYIAPEQIQASTEVSGRADVYAFGVVVYQMLSGELPFKHNNAGALLIAHLTQPAPSLLNLIPDLLEHVDWAIQRAMAKQKDDRFSTAGEFAKALA